MPQIFYWCIIFLQPYAYLKQYGYIQSMTALVSHAHSADEAIRKFQRYAQLPVTGKMDLATKRKLTGPRCGAQDFKPRSSAIGQAVSGIPVGSFRDMRRKKRYVQQGTKWQKQVFVTDRHDFNRCEIIGNTPSTYNQSYEE